MSELPHQLRPHITDVCFDKYRPPGDPGCLCSRCLLPISEETFPIELFASSGKFVFRYHPQCIGIIEADEEELE